MPQVSPDFIIKYIQNGKLRHPMYHDSTEMAEEINIHASGMFAGDLIKERRPAETEQIQKYREKIFVAKTKPVFTKVYNSLQKIPRSPDFAILYDNDLPPRITEDESLKVYTSEMIPQYGSISAWFWNVAFRYYLIDANAMVLTLPMAWDTPDNEYYKPLPKVFTSESIIDYKEGEFYLIQTTGAVQYEDEQNYYYNDGTQFLLLQNDVIQLFEYRPRKGKAYEIWTRPNELGYIPLRSMRGLCIKQEEGYSLYESRIAGIVPMLNEVIREYSDLQAEVVMHIHSTMWTMQPQSCRSCKGRGTTKGETAPIPCPDCNGVGLAPLNPYEHLSLPLPKAGEVALPTPPMGYVQKQTEIARLQDERIRQHIYDALASINMEYLSEVPLSQSGVAKQVDREELYSFVHSIATDCCRIIAEIYYDINQWRYKPAGFSDMELEEMLPAIIIPERYDLLSAGVLIQEITDMSNAKVDPAIINAAQIDLVEKRFSNDPTVRDLVKLKLILDPFAGVPEDNITMMNALGAVTKEDVIIHANINEFVNRAMQEVKGFAGLERVKQQDIIRGYAVEKSNSMKTTLIEPQPPVE